MSRPPAMDPRVQMLLDANRIVASKLKREELLPLILQLAARVVDAEAASFLLVDEKSGELYFDVATGGAGEAVKQVRLKPGQGIAGACAAEGKPILVEDAASDPRWARTTDLATGFQTKTIAAVPMKIRGRVVGVLEGINARQGRFGPEDVAFLEAFAGQAAVALENARLFERLSEQTQRLQAAFDGMEEGILLTDPQGTILQASASAQKFLGRPPNELAGRSLPEIAQQNGFRFQIPSSASGERTFVQEAARQQPKPMYVLCTATRITDEAGRTTGYIVLLRDVTESRREERLKRNFLSLISHKLKTPLVTILGYGPVLLEDTSLSDFHRHAIRSMMKQGERLAGLVEKLLTLTTLEEEVLQLALQPVPLSELLANPLAGFQAQNGRDGLVVPDLSSAPGVKADREKAALAISAVLENAAKFNPRPPAERRVEISWKEENGWIVLSVRDNGSGIPSEELDRIFEKFHQVEASFTGQVEGAGLGLALAKRVMEAHGGRIWAESRVGEGSVFHLAFPKA